jgi:diguanylate cyclase (GGDEF)-like protein
MKVLVVDDDDATRTALTNAVRALGHSCEWARDGAEAWEIQGHLHADVIISDWSMPRMNGIELCQAVRLQDDKRYTYFVFATGQSERAALLEGMRVGADEYLTKPIERIVSHQRTLERSNLRLRRDSERFFRAARVDPLTQIGNRLQLEEDLRELQTSAPLKGLRYALAICDVDWFKSYNDRYGHLMGDRALAAVGGVFREMIRSSDRCYRYGGEEFLVLWREQTGTQALTAAERIRRETEALQIDHAGNTKGIVTISIGLAEATAGPDLDAQAWLKRADGALYRAKAEGRNRVVIAEGPCDGGDKGVSDRIAS